MKLSKQTRRHTFGLALSIAIALLSAQAQALDIAPPDNNTWLLDHAGLVSDADATRIADICAALRTDASRPLYVLTIPAMATYDPGSTSIERFAARLYEEWAEHPGFPSTATWRNGILLLISKDDRKARIELGADWRGRLDAKCQRIMNSAIIPAFKRGDFSGGILAGVTALDQIARDDTAPLAGTAPSTEIAATAVTTPVPVQTMPAPARQHPVSQPHRHNPPPPSVPYQRSYNSGPSAFFVLFVILFAVVVIVSKLLGGSSQNTRYMVRGRRDFGDWMYGQGNGFLFRDYHSRGIGSRHGHGSSNSGSRSGSASSGGGRSRSGGGGGATGSW